MEDLGNLGEFSGNVPSMNVSFDLSVDETRTDDGNMTEKVEITSSADLGLPSPVPVTEEEYDEVSTEINSNDEEVDTRTALSPELQQGYRILKELMADSNKSVNWHFLEAVDDSHPETADYYERIKRPVWLGKMLDKFEERLYGTITEFVSDFRLMLENCYRYNGPDHYVSKRGQKLETMMEQKLALLSRELREKTSIAATSGQNGDDNISFSGLRRRTRTIIPHDSSALLSQLREEELRRDREQRKQQITDRKAVQEAQLQEVLDWEVNILDGKGDYMRAMWELPQIGHFLFLCQDALNIGEIPQFELERCFYMPRESVVMQKVMTALLSTPFQRLRIDKKTLMPYSIWDEKLRVKLRQWYKIFVDGHEDVQKAAVKLGIDGNFFDIVGKRNPMERRKFHKLCPYRRVWIVKSLCDYCLEHQESIRDAIESQPIEEQHDYLLGVDAHGTRYLHFPQFCGADLRIYKQEKIPEPKLPVFIDTPKQKEKEMELMETNAEMDQSQRPKKKKKKRVKPELPAPPTNRPSRLRQKIKTVLPVPSYSSSSSSSSSDDDGGDESDGSDANTRTSFGDQSDLNLNDSGICEDTPRERKNEPPNKPLHRLMESDNCSDTSSVDGDGACKRSRTRRLVRNGLLRDFNVSEQSLDESSMDRDEISEVKDETMSETSNTLDSLEDSNGACKDNDIKMEDKTASDRTETEVCESDTDSQLSHTISMKKGNDMRGYEPMDVSETEFQDTCIEMDAKGDHPQDRETTDEKQSPFCDSISHNTESPFDGISTSQLSKVHPTSAVLTEQSTSSDNTQDNLEPEFSKGNTSIDIKYESNTQTSIRPEGMSDFKLSRVGIQSPHSFGKNLKQADTSSSDIETLTSSCDKIDTNVKVEKREKDVENVLGQVLDHDYSGQSGMGKFLDHDYGQGCHADLDKVKDEATDSIEVKQEVKKEEEEIEQEEEVLPEIGPFKLIVECVEDLKQLVESFAEQEPIVIGKGKKQKVIKPPPRKRCVVDLHGRLLFLLKELEPWEQKLIQATRKARIKMHKEQTSYVEEPQQEEKWESEHSESSGSEDGENSDFNGSGDEDVVEDEERDVVIHAVTTAVAASTNNLSVSQSETMEDCDDIDVSSRGRIRKRRIIPNNSEDSGTPKKRKLVNVSLPTTVPHVPNILQRPTGKMLSSSGISSLDGSSASQILLQTSSGNHSLLPSNVKLLSGDKILQPQALSLLQKPAQLQQSFAQGISHARLLQGLSQHTLSSKQASHPVIQQLLSTSHHPNPHVSLSASSHPSPGATSSTPQRTVLFQPANKQTTVRPHITKLVSPGLSMSGAVDPQLPNIPSTGGKIQYYAANINTLPPSVLQQLIKSNALKIPPGPNQSGMVLLTTVNPQGPTSSSQSPTIAGLQIQTAQKTSVKKTVVPVTEQTLPKAVVPKTMLRLPISHQVSSAVTATPGSMIKKVIPQMNTAVNIHLSVPSVNSSLGHLHSATNASTGCAVMSVASNEVVQNTKMDNSVSVENASLGSGAVSLPPMTPSSSSLSPTNISSTSPNRQPYKYANNVTVKTLLEARKDAEKTPGEPAKPVIVKKTCEITSSTPTVLLHPTSTGIKTLKIPSKAVLDSAVQAVVTDVPTSLPTVNIKVPAPSAMPAIQPRYNVTKTIQSMKGPIPTAPRLEPASLSSNSSVNVTSPSLGQSQSNVPNQSLLTQLQTGNSPVMLTTLNKSSGLGNMVLAAAQQQQSQDKKNISLKVLPQGLQQPGVMQGYLTPQGLIIPQAALQQQQASTLNIGSINNQALAQGILKTQSPISVALNNQTVTSGTVINQGGTSVNINNQNLNSGVIGYQTISPGALGSQSIVSMPVQLGIQGGNVTSLVSGNQQMIVSHSTNTQKQNIKKALQDSGKVIQNTIHSNSGSLAANSTYGTLAKSLQAVGGQNQAGNLITGLVKTVGSNTIMTSTFSSIVNTIPSMSTSVVSSISVKPSVSSDKSSSSVLDTQKVRIQAVGGGASTLLDLGGISKLQGQGQGLLMPGLIQGMNLVNVGGQLKLQEGGNNMTILGNNSINLSTIVSSSVPTAITSASLVSSSNTLGRIFPIVTIAASGMSSVASSTGQTSQMVAPAPGTVPQSPLQLTSPLLSHLANPVGNMGNFATVLGQIASPLNKTGVISQQTAVAGNYQLLGQPGVKVTGSTGSVLRLPSQQLNVQSTSPPVIGQQLCLSGNSTQMVGQQLTSPVANQAPVVLGNIGQGSSSDLIKQLAAAQLQLSGQSSSALVNQIPNQMVLQVPASPGVKGQAVIRPPGQQNLQGSQTMLLLSPQKRLQGASIGTGTQQPKQLTLRLNSPVLQQTQQIKVPIVSSAKSTQDHGATQPSKVKLNFDLQTAKVKPGLAVASKTLLQTPVVGSVVPASVSQVTEKPVLPTNLLNQKLSIAKTNTTTIGSVQQANVVRFNTAGSQLRLPTPPQQSVVVTLPDVLNSPSPGPLLSPAKATNTSQAGGSQKLFLYNIGGQLVTPQGVPVTVDNGVLKVLLPQTKIVSPSTSSLGQAVSGTNNPPVTVVSTPNLVRYSYVVPSKLVNGTQSLIATGTLTSSIAKSNSVTSAIPSPSSILTHQSLKECSSAGQMLQSGSAINISPTVCGVSTKSTPGVMSPSIVNQNVVSHQSVINAPQAHKNLTVNVTSSMLSHHSVSPALAKGKTILAKDHVGFGNLNQIASSSNLKISQLLGQQQSNVQDVTVRLSGHPTVGDTARAVNNVAETTNLKTFQVQNDDKTQLGYQVSSLIGSGQGYIVMPGKKTQIIFPQHGQQNASSTMDNVKVLKTQNVAELLKSQKPPQTALLQQGTNTGSVSSIDIKPVQLENPTQNSTEVQSKAEVLNNNVTPFRSHNIVDKISASQTNMDINHLPGGSTVTNGVEDNQHISENVMPKVEMSWDNPSKEQSETTETPKGAEKEEAALNLLSLANLAFNR
ncbi:mucin-2-like [Ylistrum balloti]|uniref:mucin-2-like n=1 Tax=Ylistrum balloti TaxID=509963 RepID=UPI002905CFB4|nr:mucin-2-like [Ylistrum balloti]